MRFPFLAVWVWASALLLSGCGGIELVIRDTGEPDDRTSKAMAPAGEPDVDPQRRAALDEAEQLAHAIAQGAGSSAVGGPPIRWVDARHPDARDPVATRAVIPESRTLSNKRVPAAAPAPVTNPDVHLATERAVEPTTQAQPPVGYRRIAHVLAHQIRQSDDPAVRKVLKQAMISVIVGERQLDEKLLTSLEPRQRRRVERFHQSILLIADQIDAGNDEVDLDQLKELFAEQPVQIRRLVLCRRVYNYGVYDRFDSHSFVAGRPQPLIVYVELDHFTSMPLDDERHEVRLEQHIRLYNESDGLLAWQLSPEIVVDRSHNRRRDFFTVRQIVLPANLGVGKFVLKVRITDQHGHAEDVATAPVHFVASEPAMVRGFGK